MRSTTKNAGKQAFFIVALRKLRKFLINFYRFNAKLSIILNKETAMNFVIYGFIFGCFIPYLARKIGKFIPYTMGYILLKIFVPCHYMPWKKLKDNPRYIELFNRYLMRSIGWGISTAALNYIFYVCFDTKYLCFYVSLLWIMLLLVEIDKRFMLLPDVLTLPLLVLGFAYASANGIWLIPQDSNFLTIAQNSVTGAAAGYLMPVVASMAIVWKYPNAFGGGDIKLLCALGAWFGLENIGYVLLGSCVLFALSCLVNRQKVGPFGPSIVYAALIFCIFKFSV